MPPPAKRIYQHFETACSYPPGGGALPPEMVRTAVAKLSIIFGDAWVVAWAQWLSVPVPDPESARNTQYLVSAVSAAACSHLCSNGGQGSRAGNEALRFDGYCASASAPTPSEESLSRLARLASLTSSSLDSAGRRGT